MRTVSEDLFNGGNVMLGFQTHPKRNWINAYMGQPGAFCLDLHQNLPRLTAVMRRTAQVVANKIGSRFTIVRDWFVPFEKAQPALGFDKHKTFQDGVEEAVHALWCNPYDWRYRSADNLVH